MSKFSLFMKQNKTKLENGRYAPTATLVDEDGKPLEWEFKHITSKENEQIRDECTREVPVTGKPNTFRPKVDTAKYIANLITASTVYPDLYDAELQESYGVINPVDLLYTMVDNAGEYQALVAWVNQFQGFGNGLDDKVEEAKN